MKLLTLGWYLGYAALVVWLMSLASGCGGSQLVRLGAKGYYNVVCVDKAPPHLTRYRAAWMTWCATRNVRTWMWGRRCDK